MKRKSLNNKRRKEDIIRLRGEGKTYREIQQILGCSKSIIAYHCGNGSEKERLKKSNRKKETPTQCIGRKLNTFKSRMKIEKIRNKYNCFRRARKNRKVSGTDVVNNIKKNYTRQDVIDKIGENPICYLTGKKIDLCQTDTYQFDHIVPVINGGTNDLSNLGVCIKEANQAKGELSLDELYILCEDILRWRDSELNNLNNKLS